MMRPAWEMPKEQEGQHRNHQLLEMGPLRLRFASDQPSLVSGSDEEHDKPSSDKSPNPNDQSTALEALLLGAERRQKLHTVFENGLTALAAGRGRSGHSRGRGAPRGGRGHFNGGRGQFPPRPQGQEHHAPPPRQPHDGVFGAPPSPTQSGGRIQCQICRRHGHSAIDCFNRLNMAYEERVPAPHLQAYAAAAPSPASASPSGTQNWLFDSGANAHITNDLNQVSNPRPYNGTDNVNGVVDGLGPPNEEDAFARPE
ncbi:hypothetical protein ACFXTI_034279 [Malus domestica]